MTVSRVLNGQGYVSERLRSLVLAAAKDLDYSPNVLARGLKAKRTQVVGVLLPNISNPFAAGLTEGIQTLLSEHGYSCFISTTESSQAREAAAMRAFEVHRVDGIITATRDSDEGNEMLARVSKRLPVVAVGRHFEHPGIDIVAADHYRGSVLETEHLIQLGHRRIAYIGASPDSRLRRFRGYEDTLKRHGLSWDAKLIVGPTEAEAGFSRDSDGYQGFLKLMSLATPPTAVIARNDFTAMGALRAALDQGIRVPDDVAVAGFDNSPHSAYTAPPLTTVEQPAHEQGRRAALFLLQRMQGEGKQERQEFIFDCRLVVRQSTDPTVIFTGERREDRELNLCQS